MHRHLTGFHRNAAPYRRPACRARSSSPDATEPWIVALAEKDDGEDHAGAAGAARASTYARSVSYLTDQRDRPVSAFVAVVVALLTAGYMLPWAVAALRGKSNHWTIFWINLLGGWTVILWIVALVMAFSAHKSRM